ncbi:hypothetical protein ACFQL7_04735 [Halocatena marina]|uniref:Uncharacterized protein n=1 Tax=Halocatena marina TaxID=2934937 RepID=A0ABD5YM91_9EURY
MFRSAGQGLFHQPPLFGPVPLAARDIAVGINLHHKLINVLALERELGDARVVTPRSRSDEHLWIVDPAACVRCVEVVPIASVVVEPDTLIGTCHPPLVVHQREPVPDVDLAVISVALFLDFRGHRRTSETECETADPDGGTRLQEIPA